MNRKGIALMTSAHVVDDLYQGAVPALLPFLVLQRHYSYTAVAGLTLAATVLSSVAQPAFGWWADRSPRRWLIPVGFLTAAVGIGLAGYMPNYPLTWLVIAFAGLGVAAFHPEAARAARLERAALVESGGARYNDRGAACLGALRPPLTAEEARSHPWQIPVPR